MKVKYFCLSILVLAFLLCIAKKVSTQDFSDFQVSFISEEQVGLHDRGIRGGYITILSKPYSKFFYVFAPAREQKHDTPLIIWLQGGPGGSALVGAFGLNSGPITTDYETGRVYSNKYSLNNKANVLYVDQPLGVGYSFSESKGDITYNCTASGLDMYEFLVEFFKENPIYLKRRFYIAGISYAGSYIPPMAQIILEQNKLSTDIKIPLAGLIIADGITNKKIQYTSQGDYLFSQGQITKEQKKEADLCDALIGEVVTEMNDKFGNVYEFFDILSTANDFVEACGQNFISTKYIPNKLYDDTRIICLPGQDVLSDCAPKSQQQAASANSQLTFDDFINSKRFRSAFKVKNNAYDTLIYESFSKEVYKNYAADQILNYDSQLSYVLQQGVPVLLYGGDKDYNVDNIGIKRLADSLKWKGQNEFRKQKPHAYVEHRNKTGEVYHYDKLTFVKLFQAGHTADNAQPETVMNLYNQFIYQKPFYPKEATKQV